MRASYQRVPIPTGFNHSAQGYEARVTLRCPNPHPINPERVELMRYVPGGLFTETPARMGYKVGMAWKETCVMSERVQLIADYLSGEYSMSELALEYEVSRKTVYKWVGRYREGGSSALEDRSRAAHFHPNKVSPEVEQRVLELKAARPLWGAPKLRAKLLQLIGAEVCPAESTVSEILRRHGLSRIARRRRGATPSQVPLSHCQGANEVWCADFKGWFQTQDGSKCTPLTISDAHSRYLLKCQGLAGTRG